MGLIGPWLPKPGDVRANESPLGAWASKTQAPKIISFGVCMTLNQTQHRKVVEKQLLLRSKLWPHLDEGRLWVRTKQAGFTTIPRTMPLILHIMDAMSKGKPVSSTYLELWCRAFDECFVTMNRPLELAFHSGFAGQRA